MKLTKNVYIAIGLMLFAMFFGAGNLIFPVFMGQNSGINTVWATIGFCLTGVGLPILGVAAIGYSGSDLQALASRICKFYAVFFSVALYITIGPAFAIPRTATTSFEMSVAPFLGESMKSYALYIFAFLYFLLSWWLSVSPSKLVGRIGKLITPILLFFLAVLFLAYIFDPMGAWQPAQKAYGEPIKALTQGFLDGYNTMDALASFVFGIVVINSLRLFGIEHNKDIALYTLKSGLIAGLCLAVIYVFLCLIGASSVSALGMKENGAVILVGVSSYYFASFGRIMMGLIVFLACLTTSVGLITACAEYFNRLLSKGESYKLWVTIFSAVSFCIALFGLTTIIKGAIPVLMFLYPLTIALVILTFSNGLFGGYRIVYRTSILFTLVPALYDGIHAAGFSLGSIDAFMAGLPLASHGLAWLPFCLIGLILGRILASQCPEKI